MKFKRDSKINYLAEFVGTFFITISFIWSIILIDLQIISVETASISVVLSYSILSELMGKISFSSFNPSNSLNLLINKVINFENFIFYLIVQCFASILASFFVYISLTEIQLAEIRNKSILGISFNNEKDINSIFFLIFLASFLNCFLYAQLYINKGNSGNNSIAIGLINGGLFNLLFNFNGGCLNIITLIGPCFIRFTFKKIFIIIILANLLGSLLSGFINKTIYLEEDENILEENN